VPAVKARWFQLPDAFDRRDGLTDVDMDAVWDVVGVVNTVERNCVAANHGRSLACARDHDLRSGRVAADEECLEAFGDRFVPCQQPEAPAIDQGVELVDVFAVEAADAGIRSKGLAQRVEFGPIARRNVAAETERRSTRDPNASA